MSTGRGDDEEELIDGIWSTVDRECSCREREREREGGREGEER